jgi:hypothetical protein
MTDETCGRCDVPLFLTESKRDGYCDDHRGNTPAVGDPWTLQDLKDLLSTYGANYAERDAPVLINGVPLTSAMVENGTWNEETHEWVDLDRSFVLLEGAR